MFEHILVPLDQSALSEKALPYALHILPSDGTLTLFTAIQNTDTINVYPGESVPFSTPITDDVPADNIRQHANTYLDRIAASIGEAHVHIEKVVQVGSPADLIVDYSSRAHIKAIVMCTHGRTGVSRWLMGSVTQKVVTAAPCPVIVIPGRDST